MMTKKIDITLRQARCDDVWLFGDEWNNSQFLENKDGLRKFKKQMYNALFTLWNNKVRNYKII